MPRSNKLRYDVAAWDRRDGAVVAKADGHKHVGVLLHRLAVERGYWCPGDPIDLRSLLGALDRACIGVWLHQLPNGVHEAKLQRKADRRAEKKAAKSAEVEARMAARRQRP